MPIEERKAALAKLLLRSPDGIGFSEHYSGDGTIIYKHACALGCEGIVSIEFRYQCQGVNEQGAFRNHPKNRRARHSPRARTRRKIRRESSGWDENKVFLEGDKLEIAVVGGRWVLTQVSAGPKPAAAPVEHYFPTG